MRTPTSATGTTGKRFGDQRPRERACSGRPKTAECLEQESNLRLPDYHSITLTIRPLERGESAERELVFYH